MTRSGFSPSLLSVTVSRRVRTVAVVWGLLFAANALLSPALCQQFRQDAARLTTRSAPDAPAAATAHAGHHVPAAQAAHPGQHAHARHHAPAQEQQPPSAHPSDATCDFCVLASVADTSSPAAIDAPRAEPLPFLEHPSRSIHAAHFALPLIRAPPRLS